MITLAPFLETCGFVANPKRVKLLRHKDSRFDLDEIRASGWFDAYQGFQLKPIFDGCDQLVVCLGEEGNAARFIGVYNVGVRLAGSTALIPHGCPHTDWAGPGRVFYRLSKADGYEDIEERLVIDWGKGRRRHQWSPTALSWSCGRGGARCRRSATIFA